MIISPNLSPSYSSWPKLRPWLRRAYPEQGGSGMNVGALTYDPMAVLAYMGDRKLKLSPTGVSLARPLNGQGRQGAKP